MKILGVRSFNGSSLYAPDTCLCVSLSFDSQDLVIFKKYSQDVLSEFKKRFQTGRWLLSEHDLSVVYPYLSADLCLHYLKTLGCYAEGPWFTHENDDSIVHMAFGHDNIALARMAIQLSLRIVGDLFPEVAKQVFPAALHITDIENTEREFFTEASRYRKSYQVKLLTSAARKRGIPWLPLDHYQDPRSLNLFQIGYGRFQHIFRVTVSDKEPILGSQVTFSKHYTYQFLKDLGFPVPRQYLVMTGVEAREAAEKIGYPVVVKPDRGLKGLGITTGLTDPAQVHRAFKEARRARPEYPSVVVEKQIIGNDYRLLTAAGEVLSVVLRKPAQVTGDGRHTIAQLVEIENRKPERGDGLSTHLIELRLSDPELAFLRKQGLGPETVLAEGKVVHLRGTANLSTGGTLEDVSHLAHPSNKALALRISKALRIDIIAIDVMATDISRSHIDGGLQIIEINTAPGIRGAPRVDGKGHRDLAGEILDLKIPKPEQSKVPIVAIAANSDSVAASRRAMEYLSLAGRRVGLFNREGMWIKDDYWCSQDNIEGSDPVFAILRNREIDTAIVEREYESIVEYGTGSGGCDIAVILEVPEWVKTEATWQGPVAGKRIGAMLAESAKTAAVLSLDDATVARIASELAPERLCVISIKGWSDLIERHVSEGAKAVILEKQHATQVRISVVVDSPRIQHATDRPIYYLDVQESANPVSLLAAIGVFVSLGYPMQQLQSIFR